MELGLALRVVFVLDIRFFLCWVPNTGNRKLVSPLAPYVTAPVLTAVCSPFRLLVVDSDVAEVVLPCPCSMHAAVRNVINEASKRARDWHQETKRT